MQSEMERNAALKATLSKLKTPAEEAVATQSEAQKKAVSALKIIDMQEKELAYNQKIQDAELKIKHLQAEIKEDQTAMKQVQEEIDKERSSGKAVWETVGIQTVPYRDPFHTGLSKRTPTGARRPRASPRHAACHPSRPRTCLGWCHPAPGVPFAVHTPHARS